MHTFLKAAIQGICCGIAMGAMLLFGGRFWQPQRVNAQGKNIDPAPGIAAPPRLAPVDLIRAKAIELVNDRGQVVGTWRYDAAAKRSIFEQTEVDNTGKPAKAKLALTTGSGSSQVIASYDQQKTILEASIANMNCLHMQDKSGDRILLALTPAMSALVFSGTDRRARVEIVADASGRVAVHDSKGTVQPNSTLPMLVNPQGP